MIKWILQKIVGSKNQRELRRIRPTVVRINEIEEALQREPEEKLRERTQQRAGRRAGAVHQPVLHRRHAA